MGKYAKRIGICLTVVVFFWGAMIFGDKKTLRNELIRLHVVAASDSQEDQALKLQVRDAVIAGLRQELEQVADVHQAKVYLQEHLPKIEALANQVLQEAGSEETASVSLQQEEFGTRIYDTFSLPSGIYESLRIVIGDGAGKNWWCVVFPALCVGVTVDEFEDTAQCAGFTDALTGALAGETEYEVRFFVLDALGRLENFLHKG